LASILNPLLVIGLTLNFIGVVMILYAKLSTMGRPSRDPGARGSRLTSWGTATLFLGFIFQAASLLI
jgi:hypothetical protein